MNLAFRNTLLAIAIIMFLMPALPPSWAAPEGLQPDLRFTILHTNDLHARDESFLENGRYVGGMAGIGHMLRELQAERRSAMLYLKKGKKFGARISLHNRGGIRSHIEAGPITAKNVGEILSFDNTLVVATVDGGTLLKTIEPGFTGFLGARFIEVHGLKIGYDADRPTGAKIVFALAEDEAGNWQPVRSSGNYRIAINIFPAATF